MTSLLAWLGIAALAPGGASASTLAQVRSRLTARHLNPPPLFPTRLPAAFQNANVNFEHWPGVDFDIVFSRPDCSGTNFCVDLRRLDSAALDGILRDPVDLSVRQLRVGALSVYAVETGHAGTPSLLAWSEQGRTYTVSERYVSISAALGTLVALVESLHPLSSARQLDPCTVRWKAAGSVRRHGGRLIYNRNASLRMVCQGFGTDTGGIHVDWLNWGMRCALVAAAIGARYGEDGEFVADGACSAPEVARHPGVVSAIGAACSTAGGLLGFSMPLLGKISGVACTEAPAVGAKFGTWLESHHEFQVARDVIRRGLCIEYRQDLGVSSWHAVGCPAH